MRFASSALLRRRLVAIGVVALLSAGDREAGAGRAGGDRVLLLAESARPGKDDVRRLRETLAHRAEFRGRRLEPISRDRADQLLAEGQRAEALRRGRKLAREGWLLAGHVKLSAAARALRRALDSFAAAQPAHEACTEAAAVMRDLAFVRWQQGRKRASSGLLRSASHLAGDRTRLDRSRFPPTFTGFAEALSSESPQAVLISSKPGGAVIADCRTPGSTPQQVESAGWTLVRIARAGYRAWARAIEVARHATVTAELRARPKIGRAPRAALLRRLLAHTGGAAIVLWRRTDDGRLRWRALLSGERAVTIRGELAPAARGARRARDDATPKTGRRWVTVSRWLTAGLALGALAAGTTCGVFARGAADDIEQAAERGGLFDEQLSSAEHRLRPLGAAAYALWAVGAASAVASLVLWLWVDERPPTSAAPAVRVARDGAVLSWSW